MIIMRFEIKATWIQLIKLKCSDQKVSSIIYLMTKKRTPADISSLLPETFLLIADIFYLGCFLLKTAFLWPKVILPGLCKMNVTVPAARYKIYNIRLFIFDVTQLLVGRGKLIWEIWVNWLKQKARNPVWRFKIYFGGLDSNQIFE